MFGVWCAVFSYFYTNVIVLNLFSACLVLNFLYLSSNIIYLLYKKPVVDLYNFNSYRWYIFRYWKRNIWSDDNHGCVL
jgi:hypothetical protein